MNVKMPSAQMADILSQPQCVNCKWSKWVPKLTTTNMYIARDRCESQPAVGSSGLNARWSWGRAIKVFSLILHSSVSLSVGIQSAEDSVPETLVRILLACVRASKLTTSSTYWGSGTSLTELALVMLLAKTSGEMLIKYDPRATF